ncbi:MAG: hypothetical protein V2A74_08160, partial [bacterium]
MDLLRQPMQAIRDAQNERLVEMLDLCRRGHEFYRRRWVGAGGDVETVRSVEELERLPLRSKRDFMDAPE